MFIFGLAIAIFMLFSVVKKAYRSFFSQYPFSQFPPAIEYVLMPGACLLLSGLVAIASGGIINMPNRQFENTPSQTDDAQHRPWQQRRI
jgi:hypothetical protein